MVDGLGPRGATVMQWLDRGWLEAGRRRRMFKTVTLAMRWGRQCRSRREGIVDLNRRGGPVDRGLWRRSDRCPGHRPLARWLMGRDIGGIRGTISCRLCRLSDSGDYTVQDAETTRAPVRLLRWGRDWSCSRRARHQSHWFAYLRSVDRHGGL